MELESNSEKNSKAGNKERGWLKKLTFFFLAIALVLGLVLAVYSLRQNGFRIELIKEETTFTPTPEVTTTPAAIVSGPTVEWETYTNSKFGYRFKYPQGWLFTPKVVGDEGKPLYVIRETLQSNNIDDYLIEVATWSNPSRRSLVDWLHFMRDSGALALPAEDIELKANSMVGEEPAFKIWSDPISRGQEPGRCFQACPILSVYFIHGEQAYLAKLVYFKEAEGASQEIFDLFLSTFSFLE